MTATFLLILAAVLLLAFANGANDNAKGVATLIGSGSLPLRHAVALAAVTTLLGSVAAVFLADVLLQRFNGKGIVDEAVIAAPAFAACVGIGAALTVLLATLVGMPISTTHALVGALVGVGLGGGGLNWSAVFAAFFLPLLLSPLIALLLAALVYALFRFVRLRLGVDHQTCLCVDRQRVPVSVNADGAMAVAATGLALRKDQEQACRQAYAGHVVGLNAQRVLDAAHLTTAAALSFARGLNDTPKIAALMLLAGAGGAQSSLTVVGLAIAAGGVLAVRRVAHTVSHRITGMNDGQGFSANLVAATLVTLATLKFGVPVSTTHTSCGALFGIGLVNRRAHWRVIGQIVLAWAGTLPVAALLGLLAWRALNGVGQ